jgi:hypothetical protein
VWWGSILSSHLDVESPINTEIYRTSSTFKHLAFPEQTLQNTPIRQSEALDKSAIAIMPRQFFVGGNFKM